MKRRITTYGGYFERFIETLSAKESLNWSDKAILITSIIFIVTACWMVSLHSQSDQSCTSVTGSESRRNVCGSGRVHTSRQLLGFHLGERYFRAESNFSLRQKRISISE